MIGVFEEVTTWKEEKMNGHKERLVFKVIEVVIKSREINGESDGGDAI